MGETCYIIGPIGKPESDEREWADFVKDYIISPVVTESGYQAPQRSDIDQTQAMIMTGIVQQMFEADLVVADLTGHNPNVFYELGIRNCAHKPVIHLIKDGQSPPFDLAGNKAIFVSTDYKIVIKAKAEIKERIEAIRKESEQFYSHVQTYMQSKQLDAMKTSGSETESQIADSLQHLLNMTESNSDMLQRLCRATVGIPEEFMSYTELAKLAGQIKGEATRKKSSLTAISEL